MGSWMGLIVIVVVAALVQCSAAQTTHTVGDTTGWRIPTSGGAQFFVDWTNGKTFRTGDSLTFNFDASQHDVAEVRKTNFDNCGTSNTIGSIIRTSPATITLNTTGEHYYICTFNGHCDAGQKLSINVVSSSTTTPSTPPTGSPAPTSGTTPSTPPRGSPAPTSGTPSTPPRGSPAPTPGTTPSTPPKGSPPAPTSGTPPSTPTGASSPSPPPTSGSTPPSPSTASPLAAGFGIAGISVAILTALFV